MTFSTTIDLKLKEKLKVDLESQGFEFAKPQYTVFVAKKKGVTVALYESGKLTVQGKEMDEFMKFYLEPEILGHVNYSYPEAGVDLTARIGMDEAGKGDFFGPLCVAAIYGDEAGIQEMLKIGVKDSKRMTDETILKMAKKLRMNFPYTVIRLFPLKYNELYGKFKNLNRLLGWAHTAALGDLSVKTGCKNALLDQFADKSLVESMLKQKKLDVHLTQRTKGESDPVVAAASILARAAFVEGMQQLSEEVGVKLPFGAGPQVIEVARKFDRETLPKVAKTHFKTMNGI